MAVCSSTVSALSLSINLTFTVPPFGTSRSSSSTFSPCRSVSPSKKSHVAAANKSSRSSFFVNAHTSRVSRDPPLYISTAGTPRARSNHCARTPSSFTPPLPSSPSFGKKLRVSAVQERPTTRDKLASIAI